MSDDQTPMTEASMCEIIGCSSPATTTRYLIDQDRHLQVCWKHAEGEIDPNSVEKS